MDFDTVYEFGKKVGIRLQNFFNNKSPNYITWIVAYDDIMKLYLKVDASVRTVVQSLESTIESININMKKKNFFKFIVL